MMPASLNSIPVELVEEIVSHLDPPAKFPNNHPTLAAINQTSKLLNGLTTWRLYRAPRYLYCNWPLLARTLMARKDLAALVKDLYFDGTDYSQPLEPDKFPKEVAARYLEHYNQNRHYPLTADDDADVITVFDLDGGESKDTYFEMDFILNLCSGSVETLSFSSLCYEAFELIPAPAALPALKSLMSWYNDSVGPWSMHGRQPVTTNLIKAVAPNLTRLKISRIVSLPEFDSALENLIHLVVADRILHPDEFNDLLSFVPNVEEFEYECTGLYYQDDWHEFDPRQVLDAIATHCKKLKYFRMYIGGNFSYVADSHLEKVKQGFASRGIGFVLQGKPDMAPLGTTSRN